MAVHKPQGITSFDVIREFKKQAQQKEKLKKVGHMGTLDPFATGVIILAGNGGSRLQGLVHKFLYKSYRATGNLAFSTNTGDLTGQKEQDSPPQALRALAHWDWKAQQDQWKARFFNNYSQVPPMFSAAKFQGKRLYEYARKGEVIHGRPPVKRWIVDFQILSFESPLLTFEVTCSEGTYIRELFAQMARGLGLVGHLRQLTRTRVGPVARGLELGHWDGDLTPHEVPFPKLLPLPSCFLGPDMARRLRAGQGVPRPPSTPPPGAFSCCLKGHFWAQLQGEKTLLALAKSMGKNLLPVVNFV